MKLRFKLGTFGSNLCDWLLWRQLRQLSTLMFFDFKNVSFLSFAYVSQSDLFFSEKSSKFLKNSVNSSSFIMCPLRIYITSVPSHLYYISFTTLIACTPPNIVKTAKDATENFWFECIFEIFFKTFYLWPTSLYLFIYS